MYNGVDVFASLQCITSFISHMYSFMEDHIHIHTTT